MSERHKLGDGPLSPEVLRYDNGGVFITERAMTAAEARELAKFIEATDPETAPLGWANVLTMRQGDGSPTNTPYMGQPIYATEEAAKQSGERMSHYSHTVAISKPSGEQAAQQQGGE